MKCRVCETECRMFLDLGRQPIANNFIKSDQFGSEPFYHLQVFFCPSCFTVQIGECPVGAGVFNENYPFFTGTSQAMKKHFTELAELIKDKYLPANGAIMEIGSNDGTFLEHFKDGECMGFDPSESVSRVARAKGLEICSRIGFEKFPAKDSKRWHGTTDVFVSANTFAHIPDRHGVLRNIKIMLAPGGVWIDEEPYLKSIIDKLAYDQIYNEHIFYTSIASMRNTLLMHGLDLIDFELLPTHGGSIRYFTGHEKAERNEKIDDAIKHEGLNSFEIFARFGKDVESHAKRFRQQLVDLKRPIVGYGAAAKSTTVLNYCDIGPDIINRIYDTTPEKQGKFSPGKHIPVVSYSQFAKDKTPDVLLFIWNHGKEIYDKERYKTRNWLLPVAQGGAI